MPAAKKKSKKYEELSVDAVEAMVKKEYGAGAIRRASDPELTITRIPCGILSVDDVLGGGFARGRHTEMYGSFSVGKTALTYYLIAYAQSLGLNCKFFDAEHGFDPQFAASLGVDIDELKMPEFDDANRMVNLMEIDLRARVADVMIVDSIASLLPKAEREIDMEQSQMGTYQARLMSAALRRLTSANKNTAIVFINQLRENVGVMFGKKWVTSGGRAMGFYAGTRLELARTENITKNVKAIDHKSGKEKTEKITIGHRVLMRVEKDKTGGARIADSGTFVYDYELGGIDPIEDLLYLGRTYGLIHLKGDTWWVDGYEDNKIHGRQKFKKWLRKSTGIAEELTEELHQYVYEGHEAEEVEEVDDEDEEE